MISKILRVGDKVEMKRYSLSESQEESPRLYNSQLIDIVDETKLNISIPIEGGRIITLEVGGRYELRFITTSGIYICKAEIANRCKQGTLFYFVMSILSELRKDQRRQYYRLEKVKPLDYHILADEEGKMLARLALNNFKDDFEKRDVQKQLRDLRPLEHEGTLANISGGGIMFHSDEQLPRGNILRLKLLLEDTDIEPLDLFARIIASERTQNRNTGYEHRIEFVNINRDTREKIVKYVFSEDRKQRQKEKGTF